MGIPACQTRYFPLQDYLQRIDYQGEIRPDVATLKAVIRCHGLAIPFENLDVLGGLPISLSRMT
ncbi:MAG: hypothetical protein R3E89_02715 [Thiolinea sp.]